MSSDWISSVVEPLSPHSERERLLIPLSRDNSGDLLLKERLSASDLPKSPRKTFNSPSHHLFLQKVEQVGKVLREYPPVYLVVSNL